MKTRFIMVLGLLAFSARAEIVNAPMRMTETSYTVHTLTGLTSDEKIKNKLAVRPLEVKKVTVNGVAQIQFERKSKSSDHDSHVSTAGTVPYDKKAELIKVLETAKSSIGKSGIKEQKVDSVFSTESIKISVSLGPKSSLIIDIGSDKDENMCTFELSSNHLEQLITAIKHA